MTEIVVHMEDNVIDWLLEGDVAIQYQTQRDLLGVEKPSLRQRIATEGWGAQFLSHRQAGGHWGRGFYQPKWTSTHYSLLDLMQLGIAPDHPAIQASVMQVLTMHKAADGGINPTKTRDKSDVCVSGMVLNYASYFAAPAAHLESIVDFLLAEHMQDGGFNCASNQQGAVHSSLHSTLSVLEGILAYETQGYSYRLQELKQAKASGLEFILVHRLFRSHRTGEIIQPKFLQLHYPCRWLFDILRALDYFQAAKVNFDPRMQDAIDIVLKKKSVDGRWKLAAAHPGEVHFEMEQAGKPSRWNTLRATRALRHLLS